MNSRQRMLKVLNGEIPDRVPVTLFIHDEGNFLAQIYPEHDVGNYMENKFRVIDFQRKLGADIHLRMWNGCMPLWLIAGGFNTDDENDDWKVESKTATRGTSKVIYSRVVTPKGELSQEFTVSEVNKGTLNYACTKKPIKTVEDLNILKEYEPSMKESYPGYLNNIVSKVKEYLGEDGILSMWIPGGIFNHASRIIDLETIYMLFITDNDFYKKLMSHCFNRVKPFIEAIISTDLDLVNMGGNTAGGFLGSEIFEKNVLPYEKNLISFIKDRGKRVLYHNCGEIMNLAKSYLKLGADIVEPFSPPPTLGDGDLKKAKEISDGRYIIIGNIDQINVLKDGSPKIIREKVKETIEIGKPGGKFMLQPSDFLEYGTPIENVKTYVEAGKEFVNY